MKKIAFIMCLATICLSLTACGSQSGNSSSEQVNSTSTQISFNDNQNEVTSNPGRIDHVKITIDQDQSDKFTKDEIEAAADVIKEEFKKFQGCELNEIKYNGVFNKNMNDYKETKTGKEIDSANVIRLNTSFTVDEKGADPSFNAGSTYDSFSWTLIRDHKDSGWRIDNYGQG